MAKDMIFFIAFRACAGKNRDSINHLHYQQCIAFLSTMITIHLVQLLFIFNVQQIVSGRLILPFSLLYLGSIFMLIYMLIASLFKRSSLPRVLYHYGHSKLSNYARYISAAYVVLNLLTLFLIWSK